MDRTLAPPKSSQTKKRPRGGRIHALLHLERLRVHSFFRSLSLWVARGGQGTETVSQKEVGRERPGSTGLVGVHSS